ncbi:unnamed protein product [Anisakis simplex]|uniref:Reverse transcriptase domain-containing protein n=1 Tax=Anisakis simplex TaxID=6269 RepID=A0A0M3JIR7_ANISI|nr:unnamed protein product [Anisakis simplex]
MNDDLDRFENQITDFQILDNTCPGYSTATTPKPKPGLGCDYDVLIGMDLSGAVPTQTYLNVRMYLDQLPFCHIYKMISC